MHWYMYVVLKRKQFSYIAGETAYVLCLFFLLAVTHPDYVIANV